MKKMMTKVYPMIDLGENNSKNADKKVCYIVGAGVLNENSFAFVNRGLLIAADGGYNPLKERGIIPDYLVGDFDSLDKIPQDVPIETYSKEKDETDMMLAINKGLDLGFKNFVIYGGLGGRLDHSMANIQLLAYITKNKGKGYLIQGETVITVISNDSHRIKAQKNGYLSVFSLSDQAKWVTLVGLKYALKNASLANDYPIGVSNEFIGEEVFIQVKEGSLMILWTCENPEQSLFTDLT